MDACALSRVASGNDEGYLALAEQLFDAIRHPSGLDGELPGAPAGDLGCGELISTSDLARVIRACADTMEGETGVCIAVDDLGVPLASSGGAPGDPHSDLKIGRAEFLEAMRKVESIIGRRALSVGLRAQLRFVSAPSSAPCEWQQLSAAPESQTTSTTGTRHGRSSRERGGLDNSPPLASDASFRRTSSMGSNASSPARLLDERRGSGGSSSSLGDSLGSPTSMSSASFGRSGSGASASFGRKGRMLGRPVRSHEPGGESSRFRRPSLMCDDWDELLMASEEVAAKRPKGAPSLTLPGHGASSGGGGAAGAAGASVSSQASGSDGGGDGAGPGADPRRRPTAAATAPAGCAGASSQAPEPPPAAGPAPGGGGRGQARSASPPPAARRAVRRTSTLDSGLKLGGDKPLQRRVMRSSTMDSGVACKAVKTLSVDNFRDVLEKLKLSTFTTPVELSSGRDAGSKQRGPTQSEAHLAAEAEAGAAAPGPFGGAGAWQLPQETLIILDWDDTLCPTSFIQEDRRLEWKDVAPCFTTDPEMPLQAPPQRPQDSSDDEGSRSPSPAPSAPEEPPPPGPRMADVLHRHAEVASAFLRAAAARGVVVIVTLAKPGWVEVSTRNFLPGLQDVMDELNIEVLYARSMLSRWKFRSATLDRLDVLQLMKQVAMRKCIRKHYATRPCRSWKNLVCIGDSNTEHEAISEAVFCWLQPEGADPCRCKTVKLPEGPTVLELTSELEVLRGYLERLALLDGDAHLDLTWAGSLLAGLESRLREAAGAPPAAEDGQDA